MSRSGRAFVSGTPLPCAVCRTLFTPSTVTSARQATRRSLLCPRCVKSKKAEKKAKKQNG